MEIKNDNLGDNFVKNVQIQQERNELEQRLNELSQTQTIKKTNSTIQDEMTFQEEEQELGNIMLNSSVSNSENKKKYLVLGIILIILFLSTILVIRLLNDEKKPQNDFITQEDTSEQNLKKTTSIDEEYKKILDNRVNTQINTKEEDNTTVTINRDLDLIEKQIKEKQEKIITKNKTINKEPKYIPVKKVYIPKKEPKAEVKKEIKKIISNSNTLKGYFVQVGAFSKKPSLKYISNIRNNNLKYKLYQVKINGKIFNKVLIGPYSSKNLASKNINSIKSKLKISSAYILRKINKD